jgi:DNA (cytosine-5)-methyltransferase 1
MGGLSVIGELAGIGYDAEWRVVSAASVGANHRRDRIIIVAYPNSTSRQQQCEREIQQPDIGRCGENVANAQSIQSNERQSKNNSTQSGEQRLQGKVGTSGADVANANSIGLEGSGAEQQTARTFGSSKVANAEGSNGRNKKSHDLQTVYGQTAKLGEQDCIGRTIGNWWQIEPDVGRVANGVSSRVDRLKGLGNAVVPQVAEVIGRLVMEHANNEQKQ